MHKLNVAVLASSMLAAVSAPALAFQCPSDISQIDQALESADLTDEQKQQVMDLRDEGQRLHNEGNHEEAVEALAKAKAIVGVE